MADPTKTRGYRDKNPGNLRYVESIKWQGLVGPDTTGGMGAYCVFSSYEFGIRAAAMQLITYQDKYNLRTIRTMISRWAPPADNNHTENYIKSVVASFEGRYTDTDELDLHKYENMSVMIKAVIGVELGGQPFTDRQIDDGLRLAGIPKPVTTVVAAAATQTGQGAVAVGGAAGAAALAAAASQASPAITALGALSPWVGALVVLIVAVVAVYFVLKNRKDKETI